MANQYIGDYADGAVVRFSFNTVGEDKAPITLAGVSTQSHFVVAKDGTDMTLGASTITVSVDAGGVTGRHVVTVNMGNDADFTAGSDYDIRLAAGTVDSISVVGAVLRSWSCEKRTAVGVSVRDGAIDTDTFAADTLLGESDIPAAVWGAVRASYADADTFGEGVASVVGGINTGSGTVTTLDGLDTNLSNDIAALNDLDSSAVTAACASALTTYDPPTRTEATADKDAILAALPSSGPSAATIADAVLDEALSGHATAGTLGKAVTDILAGGSAPTVSQIADAVWTEAIADHSGEAGSTAEALNNAGSAGTVSTAQVSNERTWYAEEYRSRNIVTVGNGFAGTFAVVPDINPETTIASVSSVAITGAASVTASSSAVRADKQAAHFTVPALTTSGTYTVVVKVLTNDSQTIPTTCTLKVV